MEVTECFTRSAHSLRHRQGSSLEELVGAHAEFSVGTVALLVLLSHWPSFRREYGAKAIAKALFRLFLERCCERDSLLALPLRWFPAETLALCTEGVLVDGQCSCVQEWLLGCQDISEDSAWEDSVELSVGLAASMECPALQKHFGHLCGVVADAVEIEPSRWGLNGLLKVSSLQQMGTSGKKRRRMDSHIKEQAASSLNPESEFGGAAHMMRAQGNIYCLVSAPSVSSEFKKPGKDELFRGGPG